MPCRFFGKQSLGAFTEPLKSISTYSEIRPETVFPFRDLPAEKERTEFIELLNHVKKIMKDRYKKDLFFGI